MADLGPTIRRDRLETLLRRLLDVYSPSGKEEAAVELVRRFLARHDLAARLQEVDEHRSNLVVPLGSGDPLLLLVGHLDTVVAHDLDEVASRRSGDSIFGLGAADMKGGCAAMIEAAVALAEAGHRDVAVTLCLVVGEEEDGDGAERLVEDYRAPWAIVGEPTGLLPCLSHHGYLEVGLSARGDRRHASLAGESAGAVQALLRLLLRLSDRLERMRPDVVFNVRGLSSSPQGFVVPDRCDAWLDIHCSPAASLGEITDDIEGLVSAAAREERGVDLAVSFETADDGFEISVEGRVVEALQGTLARLGLPLEPRSFRSHSDASVLFRAGIRPIMLGPGSLEQAHAPGEWVSFDEVARAAELYADLALSLPRR